MSGAKEKNDILNILSNLPSGATEGNLSIGRQRLRKWLGKMFRVETKDGRVFEGVFSCTDRDANIVLSMCFQYLKGDKEPSFIGDAMIARKDISSIAVDMKKEQAL